MVVIHKERGYVMQVIYSYLVKNSMGMELEDEIHQNKTFGTEEQAVESLKSSGYIKVDAKNYEKKLNDTLYDLATLVKQ